MHPSCIHHLVSKGVWLCDWGLGYMVIGYWLLVEVQVNRYYVNECYGLLNSFIFVTIQVMSF